MKVEIGSVSTGTLCNQDLIPTFMDLLGKLNDKKAGDLAHEYVPVEFGPDWPDDDAPWWEHEDCSYLLEELFDALDEEAPPYCYFGAHEGNGSDFGFWPHPDLLRDDHGLDTVKDLADAEDSEHPYVLVVNDHGNMTLYEKEVTFKEVWSCV